MSVVLVLGTGGTIASRSADGAAVAVDGVTGVLGGLGGLGGLDGLDVRSRDLLVKDSSALTTADQARIAREVRAALTAPAVTGVVVTHGTDTAEETAYLLDLVHTDPRPVVVTGAGRPADDPEPDGPRNLADAVRVAADPAARGRGALIVFGGQVLAARGTRKVALGEPAVFAPHDGRVLGRVGEDGPRFEGPPQDRPHLGPAALDLERVRVDVAALHPGADDVALRAFVAAGARGVVLQATGSGNTSPGIVDAVADLHRGGVVVALTTRVDRGVVVPSYGGGGGAVDLVAAGAVPLGALRAGQGRMLLLALLADLGDPEAVRAALPSYALV